MKKNYSIILMLFIFAFSANAKDFFTFTSSGSSFIINNLNSEVTGDISFVYEKDTKKTIILGETVSIEPNKQYTVIGDFKKLNVKGNSLTSLDVSAQVYLSQLDCSSNKLTSLDVSGQVYLSQLDCSSNKLTSLDVSGLIHLSELNCSFNTLTFLGVLGLPELDFLDCRYNELIDIKTDSDTKIPKSASLYVQRINVPMIINVNGSGFISSNKYEITDGHIFTFASDVTGISFKDGYFKSATMPKGDKGFINDVGYGSDKKITGVLVFDEDPNAGIMDFTLNSSRAKQFNIKVYPNPAETNREITVENNLKPEQYKGAVINIYSVLGVLTQSIKVAGNKTSFVIPNQGVYLVQFKSASLNRTKKIIVK